MRRLYLINSASCLPFASQHDARSKRMRVGFKLKVRLIPQWSDAESPARMCWLLRSTFLFPSASKVYVSLCVMWCGADLWDTEEQCQCQAHPLRWVFISIQWRQDLSDAWFYFDSMTTRSKESQWVPGAKFIFSSNNKLKNTFAWLIWKTKSRSVEQREQCQHCTTSLPILVAGSLYKTVQRFLGSFVWIRPILTGNKTCSKFCIYQSLRGKFLSQSMFCGTGLLPWFPQRFCWPPGFNKTCARTISLNNKVILLPTPAALQKIDALLPYIVLPHPLVRQHGLLFSLSCTSPPRWWQEAKICWNQLSVGNPIETSCVQLMNLPEDTANHQSGMTALDLHCSTLEFSEPLTQFAVVFLPWFMTCWITRPVEFSIDKDWSGIARIFNYKSIAEQNLVVVAWELLRSLDSPTCERAI